MSDPLPPLFQAIKDENLAEVTRLIEAGLVDINTAVAPYGTPFMYATNLHKEEFKSDKSKTIYKFLLDHGATFNLDATNTESVLWQATRGSDNHEMVKLILASNRPISSKMLDDAYYTAAANGMLNSMHLILQYCIEKKLPGLPNSAMLGLALFRISSPGAYAEEAEKTKPGLFQEHLELMLSQHYDFLSSGNAYSIAHTPIDSCYKGALSEDEDKSGVGHATLNQLYDCLLGRVNTALKNESTHKEVKAAAENALAVIQAIHQSEHSKNEGTLEKYKNVCDKYSEYQNALFKESENRRQQRRPGDPIIQVEIKKGEALTKQYNQIGGQYNRILHDKYLLCMSLAHVESMLTTPSKENIARLNNFISELPGHSAPFKKLIGALVMLVGVALAVAGVCASVLSLGTGVAIGATAVVCASVLSLGASVAIGATAVVKGVTLFQLGREQGLAKAARNLTAVAAKHS